MSDLLELHRNELILANTSQGENPAKVLDWLQALNRTSKQIEHVDWLVAFKVIASQEYEVGKPIAENPLQKVKKAAEDLYLSTLMNMLNGGQVVDHVAAITNRAVGLKKKIFVHYVEEGGRPPEGDVLAQVIEISTGKNRSDINAKACETVFLTANNHAIKGDAYKLYNSVEAMSKVIIRDIAMNTVFSVEPLYRRYLDEDKKNPGTIYQFIGSEDYVGFQQNFKELIGKILTYCPDDDVKRIVATGVTKIFQNDELMEIEKRRINYAYTQSQAKRPSTIKPSKGHEGPGKGPSS